VLEDGTYPYRRPSARARRRTDHRLRNLGRSRRDARAHGHGTPGSRLALAPGLDDPEWICQQNLLFVGVDRPGYGYSDPWAEASLLDCAEDLVRVANHLGLERFAALGVSGGAPYVLALCVLVPERLRGVAIVSGAACWTVPVHWRVCPRAI
jgi:pimeloyl-ACP methyl ester carboxylesterase